MATISEVTYPLWKSIAWRFLRAGVSGGIAAVALQATTLNGDLANVEVYARALIAAFITGFISAAGLFFRDNFGETNRGEGVVNKLPL